VDALVERLREFVRLNYMTAAQLARQIGVHDSTVYAWLLGQARPVEPKRLVAFLDAFSRENGSGIAPIGYEYREYKNWRGIPKPRRCPFCKQAKGEIRKICGGFLGVCPSRDARGPKRESHDAALREWNGKG
jgi:transcriptional regulator with XRE-family HTH domain